ncbi:hypothetical protein [Acidithiobacillus sp.]|jgi:hypothetical protein|uniref:hypothetical protein n=1 Tax=Acidithiobacillus sp. TaxID=1872118 RepID=UPI0025C6268A|nr:hypothetical protein [Acidithiobacillus sp.]MCK9187553.1 hypothetical protein [Acidithiobacillus sp.]MCK9358443.1 hypothetical protein [Acidithiobacillus sp.]
MTHEKFTCVRTANEQTQQRAANRGASQKSSARMFAGILLTTFRLVKLKKPEP